nr:reverse transcriptase domain-containing protein [Tanacetum cinerariifolium]
MQPVAPPSPDYIPCPEEPQTPPAPRDEDERELMFIQPHDTDYVPEPMYPEYIPLEDEHGLLAEEQPLPPVDSPIVESPRYVIESDPEEDPEESEDDETEDGLFDYPMDEGDDDDGDSSRDDADDKDEDEEEEEHLASADSAVVILIVNLVSPPKGTESVLPPPSTETTTIGARITVRLQVAISLLPEAEVKRLLAMPTPPQSPLNSLSPPSVGEFLARCTTPSSCPSPPPIPSPLLPSSGYPTQIQTLRMASTQELIGVVTAALPSPPLPPPLYIPPPVDHRDDVLETEMPPRKRFCLSTLGSRYEVGYVIRDTWVDSVEAVPEIVPMTLGEVNTRVTELAELYEHDTHDLYALLEDAQDSMTRISQRAIHSELQTHHEQVYAHEFQLHAHQTQLQLQGTLIQIQHQVHETHYQIQQAEIAELREADCRRKAQMVDRVIGDIRRGMGDMQAELLALREQPRRARQQGSDARVSDHQDAPRDTNRTEGVNSQIRSLGPDAYSMTWKVFKKKTMEKYCPQGRQTNNKRKDDDLSKNNHGHQQQLAKRQNVAKFYNMGSGEKKPYGGKLPKSFGNANVVNAQRDNRAIHKGNGCFECGAPGHFKSDCKKLKNNDGGNVNTQGWVYAVGNAEKKGNASRDLDSNFVMELGSFDVIIGMDWLRRFHAVIVCDEKLVRVPYGNETLIFHDDESNDEKESQLTIISCSKAQEYMAKGCQIFLAHIFAKKEEDKSEGKQLKDVPIVQDFPEVFPEDLSGLPPAQPVEFQIDLISKEPPS